MSSITLSAEARTVFGKKVKTLRALGLIPATVYGKNVEAASLQMESRAFQLTLKEAGRSKPIALSVDGTTYNVLIHDIQRHPVSREALHVDFLVVSE